MKGVPPFVEIPLGGAPEAPTCQAKVADKWQTQLVDRGAERVVGLSLHSGNLIGMVALLDTDQLDRLIVNLQMRRRLLTPGSPSLG